MGKRGNLSNCNLKKYIYNEKVRETTDKNKTTAKLFEQLNIS